MVASIFACEAETVIADDLVNIFQGSCGLLRLAKYLKATIISGYLI